MAIDLNSRFKFEQIKNFVDGELIFKEGDQGRELYIISEGEVVIKKETEKGTIELAHFSRGDFFGDMALLQGIPRFASAYSKGNSKILIIQPGGFLLKIRRDPTFAFEMLQQLSLRVKNSSERFIEAINKHDLNEELIEHLKEQK